MVHQYKVQAFQPKIAGCAGQDRGWDPERCSQFQAFLNQHTSDGWRLHSYEYREVLATGCLQSKGAWLVCVFERSA